MKKIILNALILSSILLMTNCITSYAISTYQFDKGMKKGIEYFNKGMFPEAKDEFQWFCDYNWGQMNSEQQKYSLDYLDAAKANATKRTSDMDYSCYIGEWLTNPYNSYTKRSCYIHITHK